MNHPRVVASTVVNGGFWLPAGLRLFQREPYEPHPALLVSTVQLDGAHAEDPLGWLEPETGFETLVFIEGCSFFDLYAEKYATREEAELGHARILEQLESKTLPMRIVINNYYVSEQSKAA